MYCPSPLAAVGPRPGRLSTNLRILRIGRQGARCSDRSRQPARRIQQEARSRAVRVVRRDAGVVGDQLSVPADQGLADRSGLEREWARRQAPGHERCPWRPFALRPQPLPASPSAARRVARAFHERNGLDPGMSLRPAASVTVITRSDPVVSARFDCPLSTSAVHGRAAAIARMIANRIGATDGSHRCIPLFLEPRFPVHFGLRKLGHSNLVP